MCDVAKTSNYCTMHSDCHVWLWLVLQLMNLQQICPMVAECTFLGLPEAIFRCLRDEWLRDQDIMMLDSAFCNHVARRRFTASAYEKSKIYSVRASSEPTNMSFLRWAIARGARFDVLTVTDDLLSDDELLTMVLSVSCQNLRTVHYCNYDFVDRSCCDMFIEIVRLCPNITYVDIESTSQVDEAEQVGNCLQVVAQGFLQLNTLIISVSLPNASGLLSSVAHCKHLRRLTISGLAVDSNVAIPSLTYLDCRSAYVEADVLTAVGRYCHELRTLHVIYDGSDGNDHHITDVGVRAVLLGCPKLRETDLVHTASIGDELRVEIASHCNFSRLNLSNWEQMSEHLAMEALMACPNLTELDCIQCEWMTDGALAVCAQHCPLLESLSLWGCANVTSDGVRTLVTKLGGQLRKIDFTDCTRLADEAISAVAEQCPRLVQLRCPPNVSDAAVVALAERCSQLTTVFLSISTVEDSGLAALAMHCPKLKALYLHGCPFVSLHGVRALAKHCRLLTHLELPRHLSTKNAHIRELLRKSCAITFW
jgi:hypothetical protein